MTCMCNRRSAILALLCVLLVQTSPRAQTAVGNFKRVVYAVDARTIASNGGGTPATLTLTPTGSYVALTCNDPDGCTITLGETGIPDGMPVTIVNVTANVCTFADTSGVTELAGAYTMAQWESLTLVYRSDRWVEESRSATGVGAGTVTTTGSPANGNLTKFSGASSITNTDLTGDVTTTGTVATTIAAGVVTLAKQANLATDRLIGRDTAGTGVPEALTVTGGLEFSGSVGIQRSALTGDVTASAGSNATTIANDAVTFAKMANTSAATRLIGRGTSAGAGDPEEITLGAGMSMAGTVLSSTVVGTGGGDVVGPGSATTLAVARFDGTTGKLIKDTSTLTLSDAGAFTFADGVRQTFNPNGTTPGISVGSQAGDPSTPSNGDLWYDSTGNLLRARVNGATVSLGASGSSGALVLVEQHTASASTSLDFTTCLTSTYDTYMIDIVNIIPASATVLRFLVSTDGGSTWDATGIYDSGAIYSYPGNTGPMGASNSVGYWPLRDANTTLSTNGTWNASLRLMHPLGAKNKTMFGLVLVDDNSVGPLRLDFSGRYRSTTAVNAFQMKAASGNLTSGTVLCYGVAKS